MDVTRAQGTFGIFSEQASFKKLRRQKTLSKVECLLLCDSWTCYFQQAGNGQSRRYI